MGEVLYTLFHKISMQGGIEGWVLIFGICGGCCLFTILVCVCDMGYFPSKDGGCGCTKQFAMSGKV